MLERNLVKRNLLERKKSSLTSKEIFLNFERNLLDLLELQKKSFRKNSARKKTSQKKSS